MTQPPYPHDGATAHKQPYPHYQQPFPPPPPAQPRRRPAALYAGLAVVILAALGIGAYFVFFAGSSSGYASPAKAADALMKAAQARDVGAVKQALCPADRAMAGQFTSPQSGGQLVSYSIGATTARDATHAMVHVDVVTTDGNDTSDLPVTKESAGWQVCVTDLLQQLPTSIPTA